MLIMAAGTGGHVFPALAIANKLKEKNVRVEWLGTPQGMENSLLATTDIALHKISVKGLRGAGIARLILAPIMLLVAFYQSINVIRKVRPDCILGMGGFICGPAGVAAKFMGKPLLIHEQNAVPGLTNKLLSKFAAKVFEAFPNTFDKKIKAIYTGNPLRKEIVSLASRKQSLGIDADFKLLVLGGSQGALAINKVLPEVVANWPESPGLQIRHQTGSVSFQETLEHYSALGISQGEKTRVEPFINDMAEAYEWADFVICRSGASTVSELAVVGLPSILVPYPYHKDQQQLLNAQWIAQGNAATIIEQSSLSVTSVLTILMELNGNRERLVKLGEKVKELAMTNADEIVCGHCMEFANAQ